MTFSWTGRSLTGATVGTNSYIFTYNDEGIRTSKTKNGVTTTYYLNGSAIVGEATNGNLILYVYDETGVIGFRYHGSSYAQNAWDTYWFEKNLQGDIIAVYSSSGTKLITYKYDAWGNATVTYHNGGASTTAVNNPFRYRGYYYDSDLGLYYLNSRYYDSYTGRFINADSMMSGVNGSLDGFNLYAYCFNNPVNMTDSSGNWPSWAIKLVAAVAIVAVVTVAAAVTVATAGAGTAIAAVAVGAAKGAAIGFVAGAASGAAIGYVTTGTLEGALEGMADGALSGAISGAIAGGITGGLSYNSGATSAGKGFDTYRQLKNEIGSPGAGNEWHHIVEQCQISKSGFSPQMIQNTNNIMSISKTTHQAISGYYSSVQPFTNGMIVRNWLAGQSFSAQYKFGISVINMFM